MSTIMEGSPTNSSSVQIGLPHVWTHKSIKGLSPPYHLSTCQRGYVHLLRDFFYLSLFLFGLPIQTFDGLSVRHHLIENEYRVCLPHPINFLSLFLFEDFNIWVPVVNLGIVPEDGCSSRFFNSVLFLRNFFFPSLDLLWFVEWNFLGLFPAVIRHFIYIISNYNLV